MAEFLLTFALEEILSKVISAASSEIKLVSGSENELKKLRESMLMAQAVLEDAGERQTKDKSVALWLQRLNDVAYEAMDILDLFDYEKLRQKVEVQGRLRNQVRDFLSLSKNPVVFRHNLGKSIKKVNHKLDVIKSDMTGYGLKKDSMDRSTNQDGYGTETDSLLGTTEVVFGRENEASKIIGLLTGVSLEQDLSAVAIVGMPGVGKTTLAKLVCAEAKEKKLFEQLIWVCVSDNFDEKKILEEMLQSLDPTCGGLDNMNGILQHLRTRLNNQKYLLVLDDVWNRESDKWNNFKSRLHKINEGTKCFIVVTTRSEHVALALEIRSQNIYRPRMLSDDQCWKIIENKAFQNRKTARPDLESIGQEIAKKCNGLPLLAMVLGGTLRFKSNENDWLAILNDDAWDTMAIDCQVLPILKLSFDRLPSSSIKQCFAYCSIFPKDYVLVKDDLIQLWVAEGFIQPNETSQKCMEDVGHEYLDVLLANSLFQDVKEDKSGNVICLKMHDLVHDLALSVSRHRAWYLIDDVDKFETLNITEVQKFRSIFIIGDKLPEKLRNCKSLRVLKLLHPHSYYPCDSDTYDLPEWLDELKHLRYLDIRDSSVRYLSESITKLYHLRTLRVGNGRLERLSSGLQSLTSLRHVCADFIGIAKGIGSLTNLVTLSNFCIDIENGQYIEELGGLVQLRGRLPIFRLENVRNKEEAMRARMETKSKLDKVQYHWNREDKDNSSQEAVLDGLQPNSNTKSLTVDRFKGKHLPRWFDDALVLGSLVELEFRHCTNCMELPDSLGRLPRLKYLIINGMSKVRYIFRASINELSSATIIFPALVHLYIVKMDCLEELVQTTSTMVGILMFPQLATLNIRRCSQLRKLHVGRMRCLEDLSIHDCPSLSEMDDTEEASFPLGVKRVEIRSCGKLRRIPNLYGLASLEQLFVTSCKGVESIIWVPRFGSSLQSCVVDEENDLPPYPLPPQELMRQGEFSSLTHLELGPFSAELEEFPDISFILYCPRLQTVSLFGWNKLKYLPDQLRHLTCVKSLTISSFGKLETLPDWFGELSSLSQLSLRDCQNLKHLPSAQALSRLTDLKYLFITDCYLLRQNYCKHTGGDSWPHIAHIPHVRW